MSDVKLRKNPATGEVFMWEPGQTDWKPVQARKNTQSGEVFVYGDGDNDWRNIGKYEGVQVQPESRSISVQQMVADQLSQAPQGLNPRPQSTTSPQEMISPQVDHDPMDAIAALMGGIQQPALAPDVPAVNQSKPAVPEIEESAQILQSMLGMSDDVRSSRGTGRSPYLSGLVDAPQPQPMPDPVGSIEDQLARTMMGAQSVPARASPFDGETFADLATRRGQEFTQGATGVLTSVARARGIDDRTLSDAIQRDAPKRVQEAARQVEQLEAILQRGISDDGQSPMSDQERALYTRRRDEAAQAVEQWSDVQDFGPAFAGNRESGANRAADNLQAWTDETFGVPPKDESLWSDLAYGSGSMAGFMLPALVAGPAGTMVTAQMGADAAKTEAYERAKQSGASERDSQIAAQIMGFLGTAEALPIAAALNRIPASARQDVIGRLGRFLSSTVKGSIEEGAQEAGLAIAQNLVEKGAYNPERQIIDKDVGHQALVGMILGGFMGGGANAAGLQREREDSVKREAQREPTGRDDLVSSMMGPDVRRPDQGDATPPVATTPPEADREPEAVAKPDQGEGQDSNILIMDESETIDGQSVPTGRQVRVNLSTGEVTPVEDVRQPTSDTDAVPEQPDVETSVLGSDDQAAPVDSLSPSNLKEGQEVEISMSGGPRVRGKIDSVLRSGPVFVEPDGTQTPIPIEDIEDGETIIFKAGQLQERESDQDRPDLSSDNRTDVSPMQIETLSTEQVANIQTDAKTFQYKADGDAEGVTDRLQGVTDWDERSAMGGIVYEYADGRRVAADGHQRLGLAKRLQAQGKQTPWTVEVIREKDGFTPADVRRIAAFKNIREGSGTAIDAAKVLREAPDQVDELNLPPNSALVRDAKGLSRLSDDAFGSVVNGVVPESYGAAVGQYVPDPDMHSDVIRLLAKLKPKNARQAAMIAQQAGQTKTTETQTTLFGDEEVAESLYLERAKVLDGALSRIKKDRQTFKVLADRADTIQSEGNRLNSSANEKRLETDAEMQAYLQAEANRKGPISDALTEAARDLKGNPGKINRVISDFLDKIRRKDAGSVRPDRATDDRSASPDESRVRQEPTEENANVGKDDSPSTERTEAGEQTVIPGVERSEDRSDEARKADQKRELEARQKQSKLRTVTGQQEAGPLFDTQIDAFDHVDESLSDEAPEAPESPKSTSNNERIEDFGEKIEGAQKDKVSGWLVRAGQVGDSEIASVPLSKSWPEPDYQSLIDEGAEPDAVAFIHAARDEIPNKPRSTWKLKRWTEQVRIMREFSTRLIDGTYTMDQVRSKSEKIGGLKGFLGRAALYERFGHEKSLKNIIMIQGSYSVFMGERYSPAKLIWTVSHNGRIEGHGDTIKQAIDDFAGQYEKIDVGKSAARSKGIKFEIRKWRSGDIFIGKKIGRDWIEVATDPDWDWKQARSYLAENQKKLEVEFARKRALPPERGENNSPRVGEDYRNGQDVTPEMFADSFGFRGVQFGNYVESDRRQQDLNEAYDGLMDLAAVINVPPKALSLNGELGLAFGARGSGRKAAAHYEPGQVVINLTKGQGAGSLAHEWWHGMDHYFARQGGKKALLLTEGTRDLDDGIRPEVVQAFENLLKLIRSGELKTRSAVADKRKSKPYFSTMPEMTARAFESYVIGKLQDQSASNDYLSNILSEEAWTALENMAGQSAPSWPYVRASEMPEFREAFDKLFDTIRTEETSDGKVRMYQSQVEPVAVLLGDELSGDDIRSLRASAKDWFNKNLLNTTVRTNLGWDVRFNNTGQRKSTSKGEGLLRIVPALREIVENGNLIESRPGRDQNTKFMHILGATVEIRGEPMEVVVAVRESPEGKFQYDLSWNMDEKAQPKGVEGVKKQTSSRPVWNQPSLDLNIGILNTARNPIGTSGIDRFRVEALLPDLKKRLDKMNIRNVDLHFEVMPEQGSTEIDRDGNIAILIGSSLNELATLHHEAIHAMRHMNLFTAAEWRALEIKAARSWMDKHDVQTRWPELLPSEQIEEAIAEEFAEFAKGNAKPSGIISVAFSKMKRFLEAVKNVFRGAGFQTSDDVFGRALSGEVGARDRSRGRDISGSTSSVRHQRPERGIPELESRSKSEPNRKESGSFSRETINKVKRLNEMYGPPLPPKQLDAPSVFPVPTRTGLTYVQEMFQDRFVMFKAAEMAIENQTGVKLPESMDFSLRENLFHGRTAERLERVIKEEVRPLVNAMAQAKVSPDDLGLYLIARHAQERNRVMSKRDPKRFGSDGGSGLANGAAAAILEGYQKKGQEPKLRRLAGMVSTIMDRDLKLRRTSGLLSEEQFRNFKSMYENYVPLRGSAERDDGGQIGRTGAGFDIRGREVKAALGRSSLSENPLVQAIAMRQEGIIRAEKNRAGRSLMRLVQKYPNPDLWETVGKLPTRKILDPDTGTAKNIVDFGAIREDEVLGVKLDGENHYVRIRDPLMAAAVKNLDLRSQGIMARALNTIARATRAFSRLQTGANPNFVFPNGMSDFMEGIWTAYNVDAKKMMRSYVRYYPVALYQGITSEFSDSAIGRALSGKNIDRINKLMDGKFSEKEVKKFDRYREEWEMTGGKINFMAFRDLDEITRDINTQIERSGRKLWQRKPWEVIEDMVAVIEKVNQPVESAGRLAMYVAARENGLSKERAAALSLDSSGNYYKRGRATKGLASLYAFFNPAVQGIEKFMRFSKQPRNLAVLGGVVTTGYTMALYNIYAWGDDDDPEGKPLYLDIPEWERSRSIIIPKGIVEDEVEIIDENGDKKTIKRKRLDYFSFRVPHNLRPLLMLGDQLATLQAGKTDAGAATREVSRSVLMNNNPFGAETPWNMVAPTVLDPFVDVTLNRNWFGSPIHPIEYPWTEGVPQSSQFFERSTSPAAVAASQALNRASGGNRFQSGKIDVYPDTLEYFFDYTTGGLGRFLKMTGQAGADIVQGVDIAPGQVPVARSVFNRTNFWAENKRYYDYRERELNRRNQLRSAKKALDANPDDEEAASALNRLLHEMNVSIRESGKLNWTESTAKIFDRTDDELKDLRAEILRIQNDESLTRADMTKKRDALRLQIEDAQRRAREDYVKILTEISAAYGPE